MLTGQKAEVATKEEVAAYAADLRNMLQTGSLSERKAFIRSFIKEVKIKGDNATLTYTIPMQPAGLTEERLPVLSIVHYSGPWGTVPELLFEKKALIPALQQLLVSRSLLA